MGAKPCTYGAAAITTARVQASSQRWARVNPGAAAVPCPLTATPQRPTDVSPSSWSRPGRHRSAWARRARAPRARARQKARSPRHRRRLSSNRHHGHERRPRRPGLRVLAGRVGQHLRVRPARRASRASVAGSARAAATCRRQRRRRRAPGLPGTRARAGTATSTASAGARRAWYDAPPPLPPFAPLLIDQPATRASTRSCVTGARPTAPRVLSTC